MSNARTFRRRRAARGVGVGISALTLLAGTAVALPTAGAASSGPSRPNPNLRGRVADGRAGTTVRVLARSEDGRLVEAGRSSTGDGGAFTTSLNPSVLRQHADADGTIQTVTIADTPRGTPPAVPQYSSLRVSADGEVTDTTGRGVPELAVRTDADDPSAERSLSVGTTTLGSSSGAVCYTSLTKWETTAAPDTAATVAQLQIESGATGWAAGIDYRNTRTSALQTGYAVSAGVPSLSFSANGSVTRASSANASASTSVGGNGSVTTNRKVIITIGQSVDHYRCWQSPTTPPASPGYWPEYSVTVVPGVWKRDFYQDNRDNTALTSCVSPDTTQAPGVFARSSGQSWTQTGSFGVGVSSNGVSGNFAGNATVSQTDAKSKDVNQFWWNTTTSNKHLCGQRSANLASATNVGLVVAKA